MTAFLVAAPYITMVSRAVSIGIERSRRAPLSSYPPIDPKIVSDFVQNNMFAAYFSGESNGRA